MNSNSRNLYNLKKITKFNNIDQNYNKDEFKNLVIKPIQIEKPNLNIENLVEDKKKNLDKDLSESYSKRINVPYKGIIKDFDYNKKINNEKDLIIHKVTEQDKFFFNDDVDKYKSTIDTQNNEIKNIYSTTKKSEHKKDFEYQHKYKYRTKLESSDDSNLRVDRIEFYKKEQQKLENSKKKIDDILLNLIDSGVLSDNLDSIDYSKINAQELEETLKKEFGNDEFQKLMSELQN